ncbi:MAG: helix-turn-helix domain-containing protein [Bifidobacteriaceae bacterium]|jgi:excisionase family DNA binding protein|nr:helix-turn-helix domain-containing protein [Bifidobacteriaceae bacterium]
MTTPALTIEPSAFPDDPAQSAVEQAVLQIVREARRSGQRVTVNVETLWLTPEEVAERLSVSRSTVSRRISAGKIKAVKIGNRNRVPYPEFQRIWRESMLAMSRASAADVEAELFAGG